MSKVGFNARLHEVGDPSCAKMSAWGVFGREGQHRVTVVGLTFRPGMPQRVHEELHGLSGPTINTWRPVYRPPPSTVTDDMVAPFLAHALYLMPDATERRDALDWMAWVSQNQNEKPNFALVLGSTFEGVGKDMFLEPMRAAIGAKYVREVRPADLINKFTSYLVQTKLLIVQEMHSFEQRATANILKPLLASPPDTLTIEMKGREPYQVPNIVAAVFCTNERNALAIDGTGRRYLVTWCDAAPQSATYYADLRRWLNDGGAEMAASYLLQRDVTAFNAKGRAPQSASREDMRKASRTKVEEWIEDGISEAEGDFAPDLVIAETLRTAIPSAAIGKYGVMSSEQFANKLRSTGATRMGDKLSLGAAPIGLETPVGLKRENTVYALRNAELYRDLPKEALKAAYWAEQRKTIALLDGRRAPYAFSEGEQVRQ
jgi:hypothetical protein